MGRAKPICPTCDYEITFNGDRCPFCLRDFHDLCLSARGCQRAACARAYENPPEQFYERRSLLISIASALVLGAVAFGLLPRPAGDSPLLQRALGLAMVTACASTFVLQRRRQSQLKPWTSGLAGLATFWSALLCLAATIALIRPLPAPAYDLIAAAALGTAGVCVVSLLSRFSRTAALLSLGVLGQVYFMVHFAATPRVDNLAGSASELYRCVRAGVMPAVSHPAPKEKETTAEAASAVEMQKKAQSLMKDFKNYEKVRSKIESQLLRRSTP